MKGITIRLKEEDYQVLLKMAQERGMTVHGLVKSVLKSLISGTGEAGAGPQVQEVLSKVLDRVSELANAVSQLTRRIEQLEERVGRLEGAPPMEEQKVAKLAPSPAPTPKPKPVPRFFEEEGKGTGPPQKAAALTSQSSQKIKVWEFKPRPCKAFTKKWIAEESEVRDVKKFVEQWEGMGWEARDLDEVVVVMDLTRREEAVDAVLKFLKEKKVNGVGELAEFARKLKPGTEEWDLAWTALVLAKDGEIFFDGEWKRSATTAKAAPPSDQG
jgi:hypothetical protein